MPASLDPMGPHAQGKLVVQLQSLLWIGQTDAHCAGRVNQKVLPCST